MARHSTTITIDLREDQGHQLEALHSKVPITSLHAVARAVFQRGLISLAEHPEQLTQLLLAQRRPRNR